MMLCCWCLSRSQGSFWGISASLSTGSIGKVLIDQSLEDIGNAQYLRKTRNKQVKEAHASKFDIITHNETEWKMDHPGIHWILVKLFVKFTLRPQIRVIVSSYILSLERKTSTSSIKEEGKLSKNWVVKCQFTQISSLLQKFLMIMVSGK